MIRVEYSNQPPTLHKVVEAHGQAVIAGSCIKAGMMGYSAFIAIHEKDRLKTSNDDLGIIEEEIQVSEDSADLYAVYRASLLAIEHRINVICTSSMSVIVALQSASRGLKHPITDQKLWPTDLFSRLMNALKGADIKFHLIRPYKKSTQMALAPIDAKIHQQKERPSINITQPPQHDRMRLVMPRELYNMFAKIGDGDALSGAWIAAKSYLNER